MEQFNLKSGPIAAPVNSVGSYVNTIFHLSHKELFINLSISLHACLCQRTVCYTGNKALVFQCCLTFISTPIKRFCHWGTDAEQNPSHFLSPSCFLSLLTLLPPIIRDVCMSRGGGVRGLQLLAPSFHLPLLAIN